MKSIHDPKTSSETTNDNRGSTNSWRRSNMKICQSKQYIDFERRATMYICRSKQFTFLNRRSKHFDAFSRRSKIYFAFDGSFHSLKQKKNQPRFTKNSTFQKCETVRRVVAL